MDLNRLHNARGGAAAKALVVLVVIALLGFAAWRFGLLDGALQFLGGNASPPAEPLMASPAEQVEDRSGQDGGASSDPSAAAVADSASGGSWFGTSLYAYRQLDEQGRAIYDTILSAYRSRTEQPLPDGLTNEEISRINEYVMADHPELFYIDSCNILTLTSTGLFGDVSESKSVKGTYLYDEARTIELQAQLDGIVAEWISEIPQGSDDYAKAKVVYERLIRTVDYDVAARENIDSSDQTCISALIGGKAVCAGYSKAFEYLMQAMGIECVNAIGVGNGEAHSWDVALLDGSYYHIDPTWGDPLYAGDDSGEARDEVSFDYLCLTTGDILKTHEPTSPYVLPECTSLDDNYYMREGLFLSAPDIDAVEAIVDAASSVGESHVRFRCSDIGVEDELRRLLIDDGAVYSITGADTIRYNTPNELNTISLWW